MKARLVSTLAAALLSSSAFAQNAGPPTLSSAFDALDANKDARIDRNEAQASPVVTQGFATADSNRDGVIMREEFNATFKMRTPDSEPPGAPVPPSNPPPQ